MNNVFARKPGIFFLILLLFSLMSVTHAQFRTELFGTASPGSIIIGHAPKIKSIIFENKKVFCSADGWFIIGFDRDAKGVYKLKITFKDNKTESFNYDVEPADYEVQKINGLQKQMVIPPKKIRARISRESAIISSQKKKLLNDKSTEFLSGFITPVDSVDIRSIFGSGRILNGVKKNPHYGVDYAGEEGGSIKASCGGTVILAEENFYYNGTFVMISHGLGLYTIYLHMSKLIVKRGDRVKQGDIIGEMGSTGRSTGPHLHFGVQFFKKHIDPLYLIQLSIKKEV